MNTETEAILRLPLWKGCLDEMRKIGLKYGAQFKAEFFEARLRVKRTDPEFDFAVMSIRQAIEEEDGYYVRQSENGAIYEIPSAIGQAEVCNGMDARMKRLAVRAVNLRTATLENPDAQLTAEERKKIEHKLELATWRMLLVSRTKTAVDVIKKHAPRILGPVQKGEEAA